MLALTGCSRVKYNQIGRYKMQRHREIHFNVTPSYHKATCTQFRKNLNFSTHACGVPKFYKRQLWIRFKKIRQRYVMNV